MELKIVYLTLFLGCACGHLDMNVPVHKEVFDQQIFEDSLDSELCSQQISYLANNNTLLLYRFIDSSFRTPKGLLEANFADYGNYYQCLNINEEFAASTIEGKYCIIRMPLQQNITLPSLPDLPEWPDITWPEIPGLNPDSMFDKDVLKNLKYSTQLKGDVEYMPRDKVSRVAGDSSIASVTLMLAICIPKSCTTQQAISELLVNVTDIGLKYEDAFCRLPGDKQWVAADFVFIVVFSILGCMVILSTGYDVYQTVILQNDAKRLSKILLSFSIYYNTRRLVTYNAVPGTIECLDGVRSFAMMWVVVGHTFVNQVSVVVANPLDVITWITSFGSIWITMGPITVDTFFMLSGLLLVYTTAGKISRSKLIKNLHLFYLNRLLRMFPLLAAFIIIQASLLNWISDGPNWTVMTAHVERCRVYWWSTLLHIQNWLNPAEMCLAHSWYLAIDVQLHIMSPLFLFWVLGKRRRSAWLSLSIGLILSLGGASVYNFINDFQSGPIQPSRLLEDQSHFLLYYYVNTLCRSSPFFVGMIYGYLLHLNREQKFIIPKVYLTTLWACAVALLAMVTGVHYPIMQHDWNNQTVDNIINSYMRPAWALAVGWIIFACHTGYGGPINWVLSLRCFKVLSRLSYGMYIVHYPLIFLVNSAKLAPGYFGVKPSLFTFLSDFTLAAIVAYILTMLVDAPCSTLIKMFMGGPKRPPKVTITGDDGKVVNGINGTVNYANEKDEMKTNL